MTMDLGGLLAHFFTVEKDMKLAEEVCLEKACRMIEKEAKAAIGTYRYDWTPLQPETVARKARGDTPLLETSELRDSIEHNVDAGARDAYVGTDDPVAKYQEFGTSKIPARPFLGGALIAQEGKIHAMIERTMAAALVHGGPNYREMRELLHIAHMLYHEGKKFAEDFLDEDEQR
jgi:HK97 gp10 family phage protein